MTRTPRPIFESHGDFVDQDFTLGRPSMTNVDQYLACFEPKLKAIPGFLAARGYLRCYADNALTYSTYRGHVERLLLWSLIIREKPVNELKRIDAEAFLEFCKSPPANWVGPIIRNRFLANANDTSSSGSDLVPNLKWKPFTQRSSKQTRKLNEDAEEIPSVDYHSSKGSMSNVFKIASGFYEYLVEEEIASSNPFRKVTKKGQYSSTQQESNSSRALTPLQWDYVIDTAEAMAEAEPAKHERTLFILITMFSMYLRISDIVGRSNWQPSMGDFRLDADGNWWFHVVGKGNKSGKIAVRDEYVEKYLKRYRTFIGLSPLPGHQEKTPLLRTLSGRAGLSDNRFAPNIIERTLPGILSSVLLNWAPQQPWGGDLNNKVTRLVALLRSADGKVAASAIKAVVINSLRIPAALQAKFDQRVIAGFNLSLEERVDNAFFELENWPGSKNDQTLSDALGDIFGYAPFRSFRDIENQILIKPVNVSADKVLMALAR